MEKNLCKIMILPALLLFIGVSPVLGADTESPNTKVSIQIDNSTAKEVIDEIERQTDYLFVYGEKEVDLSYMVSIRADNRSVNEILDRLFSNTTIDYAVNGDNILLLSRASVAQQPQTPGKIMVSGRVSGPDGAIVGVVVMERGASNVVITDSDGRYSISVPPSATLDLSHIGYENMGIAVDNRTTIDITLHEDIQTLDDVVVIGYGTMKKSDLTGSVSNVKSSQLTNRPAVNVGQALIGQAAGVEIFENGGNPDGKIRIRIRGNNSINSNNDPLYVIDGIIGVNNTNLLNPNDIESLEVLKDASATAIYGARGANGVIMITTKRGLKGEKAVISYEGYVSVGKLARKLPLMNSSEWWETYNATMDNAAKYDPAGYAQGRYAKINTDNYTDLFDGSGQPLYDTDWQDESYRTTLSHNHQLSIRGGNDKSLYSVHVGYLNREGLMKNTYVDRFSGRLNLDTEVRPWLKMGANMSYIYSTNNNLYGNYSIKRLVQEAIPIIPVKYPDGRWGSNRDFPGGVQDTPSRYLEEMVNVTNNSQVLADAYLEFMFTKDISLKSTFAIDVSNMKRNNYSGKELIQFSKTQGGIATIATNNQIYWQNENYINWNKQIDPDNRFNLMLGMSWQERYSENLSATTQNFSDDFYQWHNLGAGTVTMPSSSGDSSWSINSYFARINYTLKDRYLFTATGRYDGSSKFGANNRYAFFPSFAFAWRASEEGFMKESNTVSNLKLRTSIGETGNQEIGNYAFVQNLASTNVIFNNTYYSSLYRSSFGNPDLKWEKTLQWDMGLDLGLFDQRIELSVDYYSKVTSDLLLNAPIPNTSGLNSIMRNIGSVRNRGLEIALNTHNVKGENFNWYSTLFFSTNRNKVIKLGENDEDIFPGPTHTQGDFVILRVGQPVGSLWGLTRLGTWGENEAAEAAKYGRLPGDIKYADLDNNGQINNDDNSIIGYTSPKWSMTFSNTINWKNIDFSFDIRFVYGHKVVNASTHNAEDRSGVANGFKSNMNAWTPTNQNTMIAERRPMRVYYDSFPDTHWMQDGSFIRGQNFVLGYTFRKPSMRVYVSGQNLFCITDYTGYDPEVATRDGAFAQGIDDFSEPKARTITLGLNVKF